MNYIKEYYDEISSGKIIAGNKIKKIYGKLVKEMDDSSLPFYFDEKKGERPIQFIETFCRQSEGQIAFVGEKVLVKAQIQQDLDHHDGGDDRKEASEHHDRAEHDQQRESLRFGQCDDAT